jgi:hypothetical protein
MKLYSYEILFIFLFCFKKGRIAPNSLQCHLQNSLGTPQKINEFHRIIKKVKTKMLLKNKTRIFWCFWCQKCITYYIYRNDIIVCLVSFIIIIHSDCKILKMGWIFFKIIFFHDYLNLKKVIFFCVFPNFVMIWVRIWIKVEL